MWWGPTALTRTVAGLPGQLLSCVLQPASPGLAGNDAWSSGTQVAPCCVRGWAALAMYQKDHPGSGASICA
jgi:hypothetical protein